MRAYNTATSATAAAGAGKAVKLMLSHYNALLFSVAVHQHAQCSGHLRHVLA
jgi:hypothetical protein